MAPPTRRLGTQIVIIDDRQTIRLHAGSNERAIPVADRRSNDHRAFAWNGVDSRIEGHLAAIEPEMINDALTRAHELLSQTAGLTDAAAEPEDRDSEGRIDIDLPMQAVYRAGRAVRLTPTEFRLLLALARRRGAVVSRDDLRRDVWPGRDVQARVIDTHIARLRRKLEDDPRQPRHILTALAAGYRLRA
jgi:DNA-binding response OmpR family regulator